MNKVEIKNIQYVFVKSILPFKIIILFFSCICLATAENKQYKITGRVLVENDHQHLVSMDGIRNSLHA